MEFDLLTTLSNETYLLTPAATGQVVRFDGYRIVTTAGETVRLQGTGPVLINKGSAWTSRARFTGAYDGPTFDGSTLSTVPAESLALRRSINGGDWVTLAEDLALDDAVTDPLPTIAGTNTYQVISRTSLPTEAIGQAVDAVLAEPGWIYINFGSNLSEVVKFYGNAKVSSSTSRAKELIHFAGRKKKVAFYALALTETTNISGRLTPDSSDLFSMKHAFREATDVCLRTPTGLRQFGALGSLDDTWLSPTLTDIRFTLEEVDYVE